MTPPYSTLLLQPEHLKDRRRLASFTRAVLRQWGVRPSRRRGQNFSVSPRYLQSFARALRLSVGSSYADLMLEVGTGLGAVTLAVLQALPQAEVVSVEVDKRLYEAASTIVGWLERLSLVMGDGLAIAEGSDISVVFSSTPFNLTSALLLSIARNNHVNTAVLGVQREVADRMLASPGSKDYGRLSVIVQLIFHTTRVSNHPASEFLPPPEVNASVILLERISSYDARLHGVVEELTACMFSQRNRLARRVLERCSQRMLGRQCLRAQGLVGESARVRELEPRVFESIARALMECS